MEFGDIGGTVGPGREEAKTALPCGFGQIRTANVCPTNLLGVPLLYEDHFVVHQQALSAAFAIAHELSREVTGIVPFRLEADRTTSLLR